MNNPNDRFEQLDQIIRESEALTIKAEKELQSFCGNLLTAMALACMAMIVLIIFQKEVLRTTRTVPGNAEKSIISRLLKDPAYFNPTAAVAFLSFQGFEVYEVQPSE
jgi:hypothetical protein